MLLYIDPGTGSMLFTILLGVLSAGVYFIRGLVLKIKYSIGSGKRTKDDDENIPEFVIFSDHKRYWNIFEPICREMEKRGKEIVYLTASSDDPALKCDLKNVKARFLGEGNKTYAALNFLKAKIVLSTTPSLDVFQWKRSRDVRYYVHIPHSAGNLSLYRMYGLDYYDAVLTNGAYQEEQVRGLEKARRMPAKELVRIGVPYLDEMLKRLEASSEREVKGTTDRSTTMATEGATGTGKKYTILLAPSWGKSGMLSRFGSDILKALKDTGYHIIVRPHPQSFTAEKKMLDDLMAELPDSEDFEWNRDNDNFEVLKKSDLMISDFSGVIFDFALVFGKPVMCTKTDFDLNPYDASWLDEEPWTFGAFPKLGHILTEEGIPDIKHLINESIESDAYKKSREEVRDAMWQHRGRGAADVADYLINKSAELDRGDVTDTVDSSDAATAS
ncbi:MAG: CDP-glycerol glycerophosphotransferase family protein [Lachnospiraceae bacterium]|nr:CDP-glycerol glycerophosphotransferase family protein [Lachnospiraceae bacterium]